MSKLFVLAILLAIWLSACAVPTQNAPTANAKTPVPTRLPTRFRAFPTGTPPAFTQLATICGGVVNLRSSPTRSSRWLAALAPGDLVRRIHDRGDWALVGHEKLYGWIYGKYICVPQR